MFCKRCGSQLPDGARFCPGCGLDLSGLARPPIRQNAPEPEPKAEPKTGPKAERKPKARKFTASSFRRPAAGDNARKKFSPKWLIPIAAVILCAVSLALPFLQNRTVERFPDPAVFFGQEAKEVDRKDDRVVYTFLFDEDPAPMVAAYEDLVNSNGHNVYLMTQIGDQTDHDYLCSTSKFLYLGSIPSWQGWTSKNALLMDDWLLDSGSHAVEVTLYNPNHFAFTAQDHYRGPAVSGPSSGAADSAPVQDLIPVETPAEAPEAPAEEAAPPAADLSGPVVPDLESYSGGALTFQKERVYLNHTDRSYGMNLDEKFIKEYMDLLESYGFTLKETYRSTDRNIKYSFDYNGSGTVETFTPDSRLKKGPAALCLWVLASEIHITYGDGITYTDTGDRTTQSLTPYEGSASSGSSSIDWEEESSSSWNNVPKIQCTRCYGKKEVDCPECRGRGTLANYGATPNYSGSSRTSYADYKDCPNCTGGKITCPRCGGTGWE